LPILLPNILFFFSLIFLNKIIQGEPNFGTWVADVAK
jgi:hypothetical protein